MCCAERPAPPEQRAPELASPEPAGASRPFDWAHQWYPVAVCDDLEAGRPARVWLFDDPIAVVRRQGTAPPPCLLSTLHMQQLIGCILHPAHALNCLPAYVDNTPSQAPLMPTPSRPASVQTLQCSPSGLLARSGAQMPSAACLPLMPHDALEISRAVRRAWS